MEGSEAYMWQESVSLSRFNNSHGTFAERGRPINWQDEVGPVCFSFRFISTPLESHMQLEIRKAASGMIFF